MQSVRIEQLRKLIVEDPNEVFYPYALALELIHSDKKEAYRLLENLIMQHSDYLPAYYQISALCIDLSEFDKASQFLQKGIEVANAQANFKTRSELQSLLDQLD